MKEEALSDEKYDDAQALEDDIATGHNGERGLQRNLKSRHLAMISLGGTIGTGLFLASGGSIASGGPGFSQVAYCLIGTM
ncbi:hypothetical protein BGZ52_013254, partial [Haplosporangium bisporale]